MPPNYPGITFDSKHVCGFCLGTQRYGILGDPQLRDFARQKEKARADFEKTVTECRGRGKYDCLVPLSGGKDSSYLTYILKQQYGLRVLAVTVDTGLLSPLQKPNVSRIVARLNVDHVFVTPKPEFFRKLYRYFLPRPGFQKKKYEEIGYVSTVCQVCCKAVHSIAMKLAAQKRIPFVALGYSPDQVEHHFYEVPHEEIHEWSWVPKELYNEPFDEDDRSYFWNPEEFDSDVFPRVLFPFHAIEYPDEKDVAKKVIELGLIEKGKTSQLVTNCQLNWLMIYLDTLKLGYNPYVASFSQLVRQGKASRRKWLLLMELADTGVGMGLYMKFWRRKEMKYVLKYLDLELEDLYRAAKSKIH